MFCNKRKLATNLAAWIFVLFVSCVNTKKSIYFVDQQDASLKSTTKIPETVIQKNDMLGITISSLNPTASEVFNAPNISYSNVSGSNLTAIGGSMQSYGYIVDVMGNIQFPILGNLKAEGLTSNQLREQIHKRLTSQKLLVDPIVSVRFLNFKVTVLGEVARPTVINVPNEKITLLEAIGFAGDLTIYGKRENVMIIREEEGNKTIKRLNLNSSELFNSPYYFLKANDIVYVEPNKAKVAGSSRTTQMLPLILSGLSFTAIIVDRLTR
jgi:polysaccharide biosynthesis/export protein